MTCRDVRELLLTIPGVSEAIVEDSPHRQGVLDLTLFVGRSVKLNELGHDHVVRLQRNRA